jgi:hypothetical protein
MVNVQKHIKKIMTIKDRGERDVALRKLAVKLGCSFSPPASVEEELIRRIQEAARSKRESCLWWIAFISAVASAFSALAAWFAVLRALNR